MVADVDEALVQEVASEVGGIAPRLDVSCEADVKDLVAFTNEGCGQIDVFCSNASIGLREAGHRKLTGSACALMLPLAHKSMEPMPVGVDPLHASAGTRHYTTSCPKQTGPMIR